MNVILNALVTATEIIPGAGIFIGILRGVTSFCIDLFENAPVIIRLLIFCCILVPLLKLRVGSMNITLIIFKLGSNTCVSRVVHTNVLSISPKRVRNNHSINLDCNAAVVGVIVPRTVGGVLPALKGRFVSLVGRASMMDFINTASLCLTFRHVNSGACSFVIPCLIVTIVCVILIIVVSFLIGLVREDLEGDSGHDWS